MTTFAYKAIDQRGAQAVGKIEGDTKVAVAATLRNQGFTVLDLNEVKQGWGQIELGGRIKSKDLTVFSRQFATMVNSGLSMLRCLYVLEEQTPNKKLAKVIGDIRADVEAGISLSDALEKHPKVFSRLYISMVRAGELGGILDEVLNRLATQLEKEDSIRRAVKSAMVYPILIGSFAILVLFGMVLFLIPIFAAMYKDLGDAQLPLLTRIMVAFSDLLRSWWGLLLLAAIILLVWGLRRLKRTDRGRETWDRMKLRMPMGIGQIIRKLAVARFSRTLGTLISSGVPILQAIEITGQAAGNAVIEKAMVQVQQSVKEGQSITKPLENVSVFPAMVTQMISVGEETGSLDAMLSKIADFYEDEVNASIKSLTSILEPILMLGVGGIVGLVVISMYLPDLQHDEHREVGTGEAGVDNEALVTAYAESGSPAALDELVRRNQNLLHHILKRFSYAQEPYEDLLQVANLGLIKAAQRFDPERGVRFSTYATAIVDGELRHHLRDTLLMRQPRWVKKVYGEIQAKSAELLRKLGRPPQMSELAEALNINEAGILEVTNLYARIELHSRNEPFSAERARRARRPGRGPLPAAGVLRPAHRGPHRALRRAGQALGLPASPHLPALLPRPHPGGGGGGDGAHAEEGVARVHQGPRQAQGDPGLQGVLTPPRRGAGRRHASRSESR